jgi:acyl dehydratase
LRQAAAKEALSVSRLPFAFQAPVARTLEGVKEMKTTDEIGRDVLLYLNDLKVGQRFVSETFLIDETQIKAFANQFDPQFFHLDEEAAKKSLFGTLVASGWHVAAITMRLLVDGGLPIGSGVIGASGNINWLKPTKAGDVLRVESEILEVSPSKSKPDRGIVTVRFETYNQRNEIVYSLTSKIVVLGRSSEIENNC